MKVAVTIHGFIDIPDVWLGTKDDAIHPLEVADFHYNDKLDVEDAINSLSTGLKKYPDDFAVDFGPCETHRVTYHSSKPILDSSERESQTPKREEKQC